MIEALLALALVVPSQVNVVDTIDPPYTFVEEPCAVLAQTAPEVSEWCAGALELNASLGYQIANGSFRFWLLEGEMWQNSYVGRYGYSYFDDASLRSARVTMQLVCVETSTGNIERNGAPYTVIANKDNPLVEGENIGRDNGGVVTLSSEGQCRIGWNREVMTVALMADQQAVGWIPGDQAQAQATIGWVDGDNRLWQGGDIDSGMTARVTMAPRWGEAGEVRAIIYPSRDWDLSGTRDDFCNSFGLGSSQLNVMNTSGVFMGISVGPQFDLCQNWWPVGADGPYGSLEISRMVPGDFGGLRNAERVLYGWPPGAVMGPGLWFPEGWPGDRFEPSGVVYVAGSLTRYGPVEDLQWNPQEQPLTIFDVPGICEDIADCIARCDAPDVTWNPLEWWNDLRDYLTCLVLPTVDVSEFTEAARTDLDNSLAMQSTRFGVDRMQNAIAIPGFVAKPCGELFSISATEGHTQRFSTCDIQPNVRGHIRAAVVIMFTGAALFTVMQLLFWAFGWEAPSVLRSSSKDEE